MTYGKTVSLCQLCIKKTYLTIKTANYITENAAMFSKSTTYWDNYLFGKVDSLKIYFNRLLKFWKLKGIFKKDAHYAQSFHYGCSSDIKVAVLIGRG